MASSSPTPNHTYRLSTCLKYGAMRSKQTRRQELEQLDLALRLRIRKTLIISGVWFGLVLVSAGIFVASKPYLDKKREERQAQPGYIPKAIPRASLNSKQQPERKD